MSNDYTLPEPAFRLTWKNAAYYVSRPNVGDTDCYTADQLHACAEHARAPLAEENARLLARVAELEKSFDELAAAVGWTRERCDQDGDAPVDVADRLRADLAAKDGEVEALKSYIDSL